MLSALLQRRSIRIANVFRSSSALKPNITGLMQRQQYFGSQSATNSENERDMFIFGEPTEAPKSSDIDGNNLGNVYKTFLDMGICPQLAIALKKTNKTIPTIIQKTSFDSIVAKNDVVLCAETGSGKTLSYLLPVLEQYYTANETENGHPRDFKYPSTVIMVPNKDLMAQVYHMSVEILQHANTVLLPTGVNGRSVQVSSGCIERVDGHWPYRGVPEDPLTHCPDILICTPAFLSAFIKGPKIIEEDFFYAIKRCVLDEADMLLEGSYKKDVEKIFDVFKVLRRRIMKQFDMKPHERVVQFILSAATVSTHGKYSVDQYLQKRFPRAERFVSASFHKHHPRIEQDFLHVDLMQQQTGDGSRSGSEVKQSSPRGFIDTDDEEGGGTVSVMTPARVDLVFRALIGALPPREDEGKDGEGEPWYPEQWKESLHSNSSSSSSSSGSSGSSSGGVEDSITLASCAAIQDIPPTMIFANTAGKARDLAAALKEYEGGLLAGVVAEFHKLVPTYEKQAALERFREQEVTGVKVLVCTDAAARGLDLPSVEHVIQAEFALNVVQHLHRNGRASRAGKKGRATMIFDDSAMDLVQSIVSGGSGAEGEGEGVRDGDGESGRIDASFSRRRGFRKNVNRKLKRQETSQQQRESY